MTMLVVGLAWLVLAIVIQLTVVRSELKRDVQMGYIDQHGHYLRPK